MGDGMDYITRQEHAEFVKRMEEADRRQDARIKALEDLTKQVSSLTISINKMTINIEGMVTEMKVQGERLDKLEGRDGEKWRTVSSYILTLIVGAAVAWGLRSIGL
mgnify:FL=1